METRAESIHMAYDGIAVDYDQHWSVHVREPQQRLTHELALRRGQRCADLGCGPGLDTVEMLRAVAPGQVVAVDSSQVMLLTAQQRARAAGLELTLSCEEAGAFIAAMPEHSYDVISLRFCLGYLDWSALLPRLPLALRAGGRIGLLTILSSSAPQAYAAYEIMVSSLGLPSVTRSAPASLAEIEELLRASGATVQSAWTHSFRLMFASGEQLARFLRDTGLATHPLLDQLSDIAATALWRRFAEIVEWQRTPEGIPLDFDLAGLIATRGDLASAPACSE
jgi:ubiquinone/menaquinone biosynthesis C-methylase UbiE